VILLLNFYRHGGRQRSSNKTAFIGDGRSVVFSLESGFLNNGAEDHLAINANEKTNLPRRLGY